jgi:hypothetical protein
LVGANDEWSAPTDQRTINYASLLPGSYRFIVRAVTADGNISPTPAIINFRILPPLWQRWWFVTLVLLTVGLGIATIYRYRVQRLIELERVRTRIATDLHDDIGASLSLIAMLSEVAQRQVPRGNPSVAEPLSSIATASRELVDSMSDIVWAVNPRKDRFSELVKRMRGSPVTRYFRGISLCNSKPPDDHDFKLGADARREIFFIVKEGVNNITPPLRVAPKPPIILEVQGWIAAARSARQRQRLRSLRKPTRVTGLGQHARAGPPAGW